MLPARGVSERPRLSSCRRPSGASPGGKSASASEGQGTGGRTSSTDHSSHVSPGFRTAVALGRNGPNSSGRVLVVLFLSQPGHDHDPGNVSVPRRQRYGTTERCVLQQAQPGVLLECGFLGESDISYEQAGMAVQLSNTQLAGDNSGVLCSRARSRRERPGDLPGRPSARRTPCPPPLAPQCCGRSHSTSANRSLRGEARSPRTASRRGLELFSRGTHFCLSEWGHLLSSGTTV